MLKIMVNYFQRNNLYGITIIKLSSTAKGEMVTIQKAIFFIYPSATKVTMNSINMHYKLYGFVLVD